jgi:hypothetical protein
MNSGIEVFFTKINKPWSNSPTGAGPLWVNVYSPDGSEKIGVYATDGYASIDLPPGRYLVTGTTGGIYENFDSNETVVNVGCGQRVCVTIIPRSIHYCVWWLNAALHIIKDNPKLAPKIAELSPQAIKSLEQIEKAIPIEFHHPSFMQESLTSLKKYIKKG